MGYLRFRVTYDVVTEDSAEHGEYAESGFAVPHGWKIPIAEVLADPDPRAYDLSLREAIGIAGRSLEDCGGSFASMDADTNYRTGEDTRYTIHPPEGITRASYARVRRILCGR